MVKSRQPKMNFYSFNLNDKKGKIMEITKNKRSNGRETKSLSKSLFNSIVFGKEIIMKKIKSKSTFSATLLALIMGASVFLAGQVWAAEMVKDPATGEMVEAPRYGGTITYPTASGIGEHADIWHGTHMGVSIVTGVLEKLSIPNWALDREVWDMRSAYVQPEHLVGALAESWQVPDDLTYIFYIRQGVRWHDKAPMNGRALTAQDVVYNFHRMLGLGSGFTEASPHAHDLTGIPFESITAESPRKVVMKLKRPYFTALRLLLDWFVFIYPPEVIQQHGDAKDWRNLVGTGPFMLTDLVDGSSLTYTKNPNYWGYDAKFPENRLPYIDRLRILEMKEEATRLAALRSGRLDLVGGIGSSQIKLIDQVESLRKTNPDLVQWPHFLRSETVYNLNLTNPHFSDIRVRIALQKALPLEEINKGYFNGQGNWIPHGMVGDSLKGYYIPYEQWPKALQEEFAYDPQEAERLLDEAGYPRGADGIRFKTHVLHYENQDIAYPELVTEYWRRIGVEVQIRTPPYTEAIALASQMKFEGMRNGEGGHHYFGEHLVTRFWGGAKVWNVIVAKDPEFDKMIDALRAANDLESYQKIFREADMYAIKKHWFIWGPDSPHFHVSHKWVKGYNGEFWFGFVNRNSLLAHLWVDQELKKEMGF